MPEKSSIISILYDIRKEAAQRKVGELGTAAKKAGKDAEKAWKGVETAMTAAAAYVGFDAITSTINRFIGASNRAENASTGWASVLINKLGKEALPAAQREVEKLTKTGLLDDATAKKIYQNLISTGFGVEQATELINRNIDVAITSRQSHYGLAESVLVWSEGVRNGNSVLSDATGISENLSTSLKKYGSKLEDLSDNSVKGAAARQALYNRTLELTEPYLGQAAVQAEKYQGVQAQLNNEIEKFNAAMGDSSKSFLTPVLSLTKNLVSRLNALTQSSKALILVITTVTAVAVSGTAALSAFAAVMGVALAPVLLTVAGIAALTAGLVYLNEEFGIFNSEVKLTAKYIRDTDKKLDDYTKKLKELGKQSRIAAEDEKALIKIKQEIGEAAKSAGIEIDAAKLSLKGLIDLAKQTQQATRQNLYYQYESGKFKREQAEQQLRKLLDDRSLFGANYDGDPYRNPSFTRNLALLNRQRSAAAQQETDALKQIRELEKSIVNLNVKKNNTQKNYISGQNKEIINHLKILEESNRFINQGAFSLDHRRMDLEFAKISDNLSKVYEKGLISAEHYYAESARLNKAYEYRKQELTLEQTAETLEEATNLAKAFQDRNVGSFAQSFGKIAQSFGAAWGGVVAAAGGVLSIMQGLISTQRDSRDLQKEINEAEENRINYLEKQLELQKAINAEKIKDVNELAIANLEDAKNALDKLLNDPNRGKSFQNVLGISDSSQIDESVISEFYDNEEGYYADISAVETIRSYLRKAVDSAFKGHNGDTVNALNRALAYINTIEDSSLKQEIYQKYKQVSNSAIDLLNLYDSGYPRGSSGARDSEKSLEDKFENIDKFLSVIISEKDEYDDLKGIIDQISEFQDEYDKIYEEENDNILQQYRALMQDLEEKRLSGVDDDTISKLKKSGLSPLVDLLSEKFGGATGESLAEAIINFNNDNDGRYDEYIDILEGILDSTEDTAKNTEDLIRTLTDTQEGTFIDIAGGGLLNWLGVNLQPANVNPDSISVGAGIYNAALATEATKSFQERTALAAEATAENTRDIADAFLELARALRDTGFSSLADTIDSRIEPAIQNIINRNYSGGLNV